MAENSASSSADSVSVSSTIVAIPPSAMVTDNTPPVFSFATGTSPLLASTQWSPWMLNPLLSLQAQQAAYSYMLGANSAGSNQAALLTQLNEAGQSEQRSSPANIYAGPAFYTGQIEHRSSPANNAGPVSTTESIHENDTPATAPAAGSRPIFQTERYSVKRRRPIDRSRE